MSKLTIFVSATIVLFLSGAEVWASPQNQAPDDQSQEAPWPEGPPPENMQISKPSPLPREAPAPPNSYYYPYHQQLTFRLGMAAETNKIANPDDTVVGFQYLFPKFVSPKLEAGADFHNNGLGHVHTGVRWFYHERSYFRPSLKAGLDILLKGSQGLATFANIENIYLRTTATLEYVVWNPYSIRLEAETLFGTKNVLLEGTLGISRGW